MFDKYSKYSPSSPAITLHFQYKQGFGEFTTNPALSSSQINCKSGSFHILRTGQTLPLTVNTIMKILQTKLTKTCEQAWQVCVLLYFSSKGILPKGAEDQHPTKQQWSYRSNHYCGRSWTGLLGNEQRNGVRVYKALPSLFTLLWGSFIFPSLQQKKLLSTGS